MKIKIDNDVFDITKRIKEIDDDYYIVFDDKNNKYELHNCKQANSYCLTCPYEQLDKRFVDLILYTHINNSDNILMDIDKNNSDLENSATKKRVDQTEYMVREIYEFSNNSSKEYSENAFKTRWI